MTSRTELSTGVEIKLSFFPLAFFLFFCRPTVVINEKSHRLNWGTHFIELPPGPHDIKVFFGYFFVAECGANSINITIVEGCKSRVIFYMPPWMLAKGSLREVVIRN